MSSQGPATIQDVADRAGVSKAAVSKVIRNAYGVSPRMRDLVGRAIEELDYRPRAAARALRGSGYTIGMELPSLTNPFLNRIIEGAVAALEDSGYQLIIAPAAAGGVEGRREIQSLLDRQVDGLIVISPVVAVPWVEEQARRTPTVMIGRHDKTGAYDTVTGDDLAGTHLMMDHLLGLGHRRIAHLTLRSGVATPGDGTPHGERVRGYEAAMADAGLADYARVLRIGLKGTDVAAETRALLAAPDRPTAIFAGSDFIALEVLRVLADAGLSTDDVAVAGYDGVPLAGHPGIGLTTIDQDGLGLGEQSAKLLLERIQGREGAAHRQTTPRLVIGSTTPPPRADRR